MREPVLPNSWLAFKYQVIKSKFCVQRIILQLGENCMKWHSHREGRWKKNLSSVNTRRAEWVFREVCAASFLRAVIGVGHNNRKCSGVFLSYTMLHPVIVVILKKAHTKKQRQQTSWSEPENFELETLVTFTLVETRTINALTPQGETDWALGIFLN